MNGKLEIAQIVQQVERDLVETQAVRRQIQEEARRLNQKPGPSLVQRARARVGGWVLGLRRRRTAALPSGDGFFDTGAAGRAV